MITDILIVLIIAIGLGCLLPSPFKSGELALGYRACAGFSLVVVLSYLFIVLLGTGFDLSFYLITGLALLGIAFLILKPAPTGLNYGQFIHPVTLFPPAICLIALVHGDMEYLPYGFDIYANWLSHSKQIWLINDYWGDQVSTGTRGSPPGWHIMLAFTAPLWGVFSHSNAIAIPTVVQISVLGLAYDLMRRWWQDENEIPAKSAGMFAFVVVLLLLAAEASWRLVPTSVLTEPPLFLTLIGIFLLALMFRNTEPDDVSMPLVMGLMLACHYSIKTQGLPAIPVAVGLVGVAAWLNRSTDGGGVRRLLVNSALVAAPAAIVFLSWKSLGPPSPKCAINVTGLLAKGVGQLDEATVAQRLAVDLALQVFAYLKSYKVVVTLGAVAGVVAALCHRRTRWIGIALIAYLVIYLLSVYWVYLSCSSSFNTYLSSLQRYLQLPVRTLHFIGLLLLALSLGSYLLRVSWAMYAKQLCVAALAAIGVLGAYQVFAVNKSLSVINNPPPPIYPTYSRYIRMIPEDTETILAIARKHGWSKPRVLMVMTYWEISPFIIAAYYGPPAARDGLPEDDTLSRWRLTYVQLRSSESLVPISNAMKPDETLEDFDIVWSLDRSEWLTRAMAPLVNEADCSTQPTKHYFVRTNDADKPFSCVPRTTVDPS